jgi:polyisoprenoid-binding protein YceI
MMKRLLLTVAMALTAIPLLADSKTYTITDDGKNYAMFTSEATLETIEGRTTKVSGTVTADPANASAASIDVTIDLSSLDTGIEMRNGHLRDRFLEVTKFPTATFKSVSLAGPKSVEPNKPVEFKVTGDFSVHGVTRRITVPVRVVAIPESELTKASRGPGDWVHATANFAIKLTDYGITVPEKLILKLADEQAIKLDVFAVARPPKPAATN